MTINSNISAPAVRLSNRRPTLTALVITLSVALSAAGCHSKDDPAETVQSDFAAAVTNGAKTFDFAAAERQFVWDRLYLFGGYTSAEAVEAAIGFKWPEGDLGPFGSGECSSVIFVRGGRVAGCFQMGKPIMLGSHNDKAGYGRAAAKFRIVRDYYVSLVQVDATTRPATRP